MMFSRTSKWLLLGSFVLSGAGCSNLMHNLQMHRLHRLNRVPDMMGGSGYNFSIPAPPLPAFDENKEAQPTGDPAANPEGKPSTE